MLFELSSTIPLSVIVLLMLLSKAIGEKYCYFYNGQDSSQSQLKKSTRGIVASNL